ncbi:MAG: nitroreductase family protein [Dehalococcoidia bacterium]
MGFSKPVTDVIRERCSWRSYDGKALDEKVRAELEGRLSRLDKGPFGVPVRIQLMDRAGPSWRTRAFGTYGFISGAKHFLAGAVEKADKDLENYGYVFEEAILHATDLGLGTCWLGGTFNRSSFARAIRLRDDEILPAVSPIGYKRNRKGVLDSTMHRTVGSANRRPWRELFFNSNLDTPVVEAEAGRYTVPLEMVRLAPSSVNGQPWRIIRIEGSDSFHFYLKRTGLSTRTADIFMPLYLQRIDIGIAMCHFEIAARELKIEGRWEVLNPGIGPLPGEVEYVVSWVGLPEF